MANSSLRSSFNHNITKQCKYYGRDVTTVQILPEATPAPEQQTSYYIHDTFDMINREETIGGRRSNQSTHW